MKNYIFSLSELHKCKDFIERRKENTKQNKLRFISMVNAKSFIHKQYYNERIGQCEEVYQIYDYLGYICDFALEVSKEYTSKPKSKYDDFKQIRID